MASFDLALKLLLSPGHEFGESDSDVDRGWVVFGITQKTLRELGYTREVNDRRLLTPKFIYQFYLKEFWQKHHLHDVNDQPTANMLLGLLVNTPAAAARNTQLALRDLQFPVKVDGLIGPLTIEAINLSTPPAFMESLHARMSDHYRRLAASNPAKYGSFRSGWLNRLDSYLHQPPDVLA